MVSVNLKKNKSILIVGASGSIGSETALRLAKDGYDVGLHFVSNIKKIKKLYNVIKKITGAKIIQSDLKNYNSCKNLIERFSKEFKNPYGLALCGGNIRWKNWNALNANDWKETFFEHCVVPFELSRLFSLKVRKNGRIVFLGSISPKYGGSNKSLNYATAKGALEIISRGLSKNLAKKNICVNVVRSGFVNTPQQRKGRSRKEIKQRIKKIPLGRAGYASEIAFAISNLFAKESSFITGEIISVAGGD